MKYDDSEEEEEEDEVICYKCKRLNHVGKFCTKNISKGKWSKVSNNDSKASGGCSNVDTGMQSGPDPTIVAAVESGGVEAGRALFSHKNEILICTPVTTLVGHRICQEEG